MAREETYAQSQKESMSAKWEALRLAGEEEDKSAGVSTRPGSGISAPASSGISSAASAAARSQPSVFGDEESLNVLALGGEAAGGARSVANGAAAESVGGSGSNGRSSDPSSVLKEFVETLGPE